VFFLETSIIIVIKTIYNIINLKKPTNMSCGCKNKNKGTQGQQPQPVQNNTQQTSSPSVQESIKKIVEKYYKKK